MSTILPLAIGVVLGAGVYLILQRDLVRVAIGLGLVTNGINLAIVAGSGIRGRDPPLLARSGDHADPLAQALVLTAIVISFGLTALLLSLGVKAHRHQGTMDTDGWQGTDDADGPEGPESPQGPEGAHP